jgi:hypothetical protein
VQRAALPGITFHGLRHSFVAILVAAGCNVREVSEWARHDSVAFTLTRYGGLFEDGLDAGVDRLEALLGSGLAPPQVQDHPQDTRLFLPVPFDLGMVSCRPGRGSSRSAGALGCSLVPPMINRPC